MSKFVVVIKIMLPLVWMLSERFVLGASNSTCLTTFLRTYCGTSSADYTYCCTVVASKGTKTNQPCLCNVLNVSPDFLAETATYCTAYVDSLVQSCGDSTTYTSLTPDYSSFIPPPAASNIYSPSGVANQMIITAVVVPIVVTIVVIIIIVISIICVCRGRSKTRPNTSLHPHNPYHYNEIIKNQQGMSSPSVSINVPPVAPIPTPTPTQTRIQTQTQTPIQTPMPTLSRQSSSVSSKSGVKGNESLQYELATLQAATDNFSDDKIIGRGGFGSVYKGTLLDGREIAVKRLSQESGQGDTEFRAEIELLAKLQHRNLVQLLGFCLKENEALLVYEFLPNKSLDCFLFDGKKRQELNWPIRFQIIRGIARGLVYLHDDAPKRTIHRDLKAPNVLLDAKMNPKIADFGLARICAVEQTHVYTRNIAGTGDYISPEYRYRGQFSTKSDVYAFGAIVLEIISGRRISSQCGELAENLMGFAWRCWTNGNSLELMDPMLKDSFISDEVEKCIHLGLLCVHDEADKRPDMSIVVHKLNTKPEVGMPQQGFFYNSSSDQSTTTSTTSQSVTSSTISDVSFLAWPPKQK